MPIERAIAACSCCFASDYERLSASPASHFRAGMLRHFLDVHVARMSLGRGALSAADFVDAFVLGDGEEVIGELTDAIAVWKRAGRRGRDAALRSLARIPGVYVPSLYDVIYDGAALVDVRPRFADVPAIVEKRTVADLADWPYPKRQLVPLIEARSFRPSICTCTCAWLSVPLASWMA